MSAIILPFKPRPKERKVTQPDARTNAHLAYTILANAQVALGHLNLRVTPEIMGIMDALEFNMDYIASIRDGANDDQTG